MASTSPPDMERLLRGKILYEGKARCVSCHGQMALRRPLSEEALFATIKFGVPGTSHIPYTHLLSDEEIWAIVQYQLNRAQKNFQNSD